MYDVSLNGLAEHINKPLGIHHIRSKLYSLPLSRLHSLLKACDECQVTDSRSAKYKILALVMDIASHRLFRPVCEHSEELEKRSFLNLKFINKGIDAINISNILHHKRVKNNIPPYFKDQSSPIISYTYTIPVASKIFNHTKVLQNLNINDLKSKPPDCTCSHSLFNYNPAGHVITGDLNIVKNDKLRQLLSKGPKYREPQNINWKQNFKLLMDSVEDYAKNWAKREKVEVDTLSEWVKAVRSLIQIRVSKLKGSMSTKASSIFKDPKVVEKLPPIILFWFVKNTTLIA